MIDEVLKNADDTSEEVSGTSFMKMGSRAHNQAITAQVVAASPGNYLAVFEGGVISKNGTVTFDEIADFDQNQGSVSTYIPISFGGLYRFRKVSGNINLHVKAVA